MHYCFVYWYVAFGKKRESDLANESRVVVGRWGVIIFLLAGTL